MKNRIFKRVVKVAQWKGSGFNLQHQKKKAKWKTLSPRKPYQFSRPKVACRESSSFDGMCWRSDPFQQLGKGFASLPSSYTVLKSYWDWPAWETAEVQRTFRNCMPQKPITVFYCYISRRNKQRHIFPPVDAQILETKMTEKMSQLSITVIKRLR